MQWTRNAKETVVKLRTVLVFIQGEGYSMLSTQATYSIKKLTETTLLGLLLVMLSKLRYLVSGLQLIMSCHPEYLHSGHRNLPCEIETGADARRP
jgi:hypothetical protein